MELILVAPSVCLPTNFSARRITTGEVIQLDLALEIFGTAVMPVARNPSRNQLFAHHSCENLAQLMADAALGLAFFFATLSENVFLARSTPL